ncbi:MAG: peptide chain release factor N(5)-glutamine methyltransferase [Hyphomicrobiales bacterium]|nr:peptide chain release factor N(5)-glutamine methyltransferase [Hyphomicrobiales bacterium]
MQPAPPDFSGLSRADALAAARRFLVASGGAAADARPLLLTALGLDAAEMVRAPEALVSAQDSARLAGFLARRLAREPVSRIIGRRGFWTLDLAVHPDVLDPRADTEALVRLALRLAPDARRILDLGCGSGAILSALLAERPHAFGVGVDLSPAACAAARANLSANGLDGRAGVVRANWTEALAGAFDLIVSNPPYIETAEMALLDADVRLHDPALALDGGPDGLDAYRALLAATPARLAPGGALALEIGWRQRAAVCALAAASGWREAGFEADLGGRDRALAFRRDRPNG